MNAQVPLAKLEQDLHVHTTWSRGDNAIVAEQTVELVAQIGHARVLGISDHFDYLADGAMDEYVRAVRGAGLRVGTEIDGHRWVPAALQAPVEYYVFHCYDTDADYRALEQLLGSDKPVIVAHPNALATRLERLPTGCLVELNNRYIWRCDWRSFYGPLAHRFRFVLSSDAHQPNWLNQTVADYVCRELGLTETLVFP